MGSLEKYVDDRLAQGRGYFCREELRQSLGKSPTAVSASVTRLINRNRLANPRHGFYIIVRPEDRVSGVPDPVRWIDPLMKYLQLDYRISLLRAAAFHGSTHQAAMIFQVIVPKQLREIEIGRSRIQFTYQSPEAFANVNRPDLLDRIKSDAGFARVAGIELTLLDCARYFHKAAGINGLAQIAEDIGGKANPRLLAKAAAAFENSSVRRLGYLLELAGHRKQADALAPFVARAKSVAMLNPAFKPIISALAEAPERNCRWKIAVNEPVETDS